MWHCMWMRGWRGGNATCSGLDQLSVTSPDTHKKIGPFWCWFPGGWFCVHSRTLWVSPMNSPVRLGVSPAASTPTGVFSLRFWGFISPLWSPGLHGLSCSPVVPPGLSALLCGTAQSANCLLAKSPLCLGCLSPLLLPVWMNVSSLTPWLSDFHAVQFSVSSGCVFVFKLLLFLFWLSKEAQCVYLCLRLGRKSEWNCFW